MREGSAALEKTSPITDDALMERLKMGDKQALELLYLRYSGVVNAVVRRGVGRLTPSEAEDVCHETFLTLRDTAHRYRPGATLRGWVCGIAVNKSHVLRRNRWLRERLVLFGAPKPAAAPDVTEIESRIDLARAFAGLSAPLRDVVVLHSLRQLSAEEIAAALGISINTVWTRLHRARHALRALLEETPS